MKKFLAIVLALVMCVALIACGESESKPTSASNGEVTTASGKPVNGSFDASDLVLVRNGKSYKCDVNINDYIKEFGDNYTKSEAMSCAYDGMDKTFEYADLGIDISTRPDGDNDIVCELYVFTEDWETLKGIKVGSSRAEVEAAYGEPTQSTPILSYYILPATQPGSDGASIYFDFQSSEYVHAIGVTAEQLIGED